MRNQSDCSENNVGFISYVAHSVVRFLHTQFELIDLFAVQAFDGSTDLGLKGGGGPMGGTELSSRKDGRHFETTEMRRRSELNALFKF